MPRSPLRRRLAASDGFTLVEMLVVVLILGTLMAIGLAAFLNQRAKAQDTHAKTGATAAATAIQIYHGDHGDYASATPGDLAKIEPALGQARNLQVTSTATTFTVTVESAAVAGATYSIQRRATGELVRTCSKPGIGSCRDQADAQGNSW